jgi:hypothetical protein
METLSRMLSRAMVGGYLSGFRVANQNVASLEISHLLVVDDTLIICDVDRDHIYDLSHILLCFEAILTLALEGQPSKI